MSSARPFWWEKIGPWAGAAALSLAAGVWVSAMPGRSRDLMEVLDWLAVWDFGAGNPYGVRGLRVDYPPHVFLLLGPLHLLPVAAAPIVHACLNLIACVLAARTTVQVVLEGAGVRALPRQRHLLILMVLTFGVFRSSLWLGQTMPLAWWLLMLSVREAARRPAVAGVCLGLGMFKLNLAVAVVLFLLMQRRARVIAWAAITVTLGTAGFAAMTGVTPSVLIRQYIDGMYAMYGAGGDVPDWISLRGLVSQPAWQPVITAYLVITGAAVAWVTARRTVASADALALWSLWALQAVAHQRFNFVMAVPAALLFSPLVRAGTPHWLFAAVVAFLAVDVPWVFLRLGWPALASSAHRVLVLVAFGWLAWWSWSRRHEAASV